MSEKELKVAVVLDKGAAKTAAQGLAQDLRGMNAQIAADAKAREAAVAALAQKGAAEQATVARDAAGRFMALFRSRAEAEAKGAQAGTAAVTRAYRQQEAAAAAAAKAARQAAKDRQAAEESSAEAISGLLKGAGSFAASMLGLDSAKALLSTIVGHFDEARTSAYEASRMVNDYRESLRELAALKGKLGQTTAATGEDLAFRTQTLQTAPEAREFQLAALGVGESSIGNQIAPAEWTKALTMAGKFQAAEGGSATAHGELIGLIPSLAKGPITGEEAFRKEQQLYKIMQPGGFSFTSGIGQYAKLAPLIKAGAYGDTEAAALLSAFSTTNREGAGENVQQFTRATIGAVGRKGVPRIEGAEPVGKYYESLGIDQEFLKKTPGDRQAIAIGGRVSADIARAEAEAGKKGEGFNPYTYLQHKGYGNQEDIGALLQFHGLVQSGAWEKKFLPLAAPGAMPTAQEAMAPIDRTMATDPMMQARKAALAGELGTVAVGAGPQEYLASIKEIAFNKLKAEGKVTQKDYAEVQALSAFGPTEALYRPRQKTDLEAQRLLFAEARRVGVAVPDTINQGRQAQGTYLGDAALMDVAAKVRAAGGDATPGLGAVAGAAQAQLGKSAAFEALGGGAVHDTLKSIDKKLGDPNQPPAPGPLVKAPEAIRR